MEDERLEYAKYTRIQGGWKQLNTREHCNWKVFICHEGKKSKLLEKELEDAMTPSMMAHHDNIEYIFTNN